MAEYGGPTNPMAGMTAYLTVDTLGSTRLVTDSSGTPQLRIDYLPFGEESFVKQLEERFGRRWRRGEKSQAKSAKFA